MLRVLSLFDGISCGYQALKNLGVDVDTYYASEVDVKAIKVSTNNHPNIIRVGDVRNVTSEMVGYVDLLIGGSPCQNLSMAGSRKGLATKDNYEIRTLEDYLNLKEGGIEFHGQSYLFWEFVRILKEVRPRYFLLENVMMNKKWSSLFNEALGVDFIKINSNLFGPQSRKRLYWTNIPLNELPTTPNLGSVKDILIESEENKFLEGDFFRMPYRVSKKDIKGLGGLRTSPKQSTRSKNSWSDCKSLSEISQPYRVFDSSGKSTTLLCGNFSIYKLPDGRYRRLNTSEMELLQGLPLGYTRGVRDSVRVHAIGNGWHVPTIEFLFSNLK